MPKGATEYGEEYRAVLMADEYTPKTKPVEIVKRWPNGREEVSHTINEDVAEGFTTLEEAVERAVKLHDQGKLVAIDYYPDGRSGYQGGRQSLISTEAPKSIVRAARV